LRAGAAGLIFVTMTEELTAQPTDRVAKARSRLEELRRDPAWVEQHPHPRGAEQRTRLSKRYDELVEQFTVEAGGDLSVAGRLLISQAATLSLRCELMQDQMLHGRTVKIDDLVRLASEARRALASISGKPGAASAPNMKVAKPGQTLAEYIKAKYSADEEAAT
jgi:hypothetical protein